MHANLRLLLFGAAVLLAALPGCGGPEGDGGAVLRVAAASDLQHVLPRLAGAFERERGGVRVVATVGASGNLARQIRQGAPFDVFLSANRRFVEELAAEGIVEPGSVAPYALGTLVLAVGEAAGDEVAGLADLARPEIKRVALASPDHAPYGMAAMQALERAGLIEALRPKLVPADSVRNAFQLVRMGNAEAGLVALSNVLGADGVRSLPVDPALHDPIVQTLGVVADSPDPDAARAFARYLLGPDGQAILRESGFRAIPREGSPSDS